MGTNVVYGNVTLRNVLTREFKQEFVRDQANTTVVKVITRAVFEGLWHRQGQTTDTAHGVLVNGARPASVPAEYASLTAALREPRRKLEITMDEQNSNGQVPPIFTAVTKPFFTCTPANTGLNTDDIENGPFPQVLDVKHVAGGETIRVVWSIQCSQMICPQADGASPVGPPPVVSHRWAVDESMDDDFHVTRTIRGTTRFTNSNAPNHAWKAYLVMYQLENGFKRSRVDFTMAEDNLSAAWSITDRQVQTAAPWPASSISGYHRESCNDQSHFIGEMSLTLTGPVGVPRGALVVTAMRAVDSRLRWIRSSHGKNASVLIHNASVTVMLGEKNEVHVSGTVQRIAGSADGKSDSLSTTGKYTFLEAVVKRLIVPLDYEEGSVIPYDASPYHENISRAPATFGYEHGNVERNPQVLFLLHCFSLPGSLCAGGGLGAGRTDQYQSPDAPDDGKGQESAGNTVVSVSTEESVDPEQSLFADSPEETIYTVYRAEAKYRLKAGNTQIPLSGGTGDTDDQDTCVVVQTRRPQAMRVVAVEAERVGSWPALPEPDATYDESGTCKATLLHHDVTLLSPRASADGAAAIYCALGSYIYALSRPLKPEEQFTTPKIPFLGLDDEGYKVEGDVLYSV